MGGTESGEEDTGEGEALGKRVERYAAHDRAGDAVAVL